MAAFGGVRPRRWLAAMLLVAGGLLAGCGWVGSDDPEFNTADVDFVVQMQQHHQQSLAMTDLVPSRAADPGVERIATRIAETQAPEIDTMAAWIVEWTAHGAQLPDDHGASSHEIPGMLPEEDMAALRSAEGVDFDVKWLEAMIEHHEGGVQLAQVQMDEGENADAKDMAEKSMQTLQAEIAEMKALLAAHG